jgi:hypothetical protein
VSDRESDALTRFAMLVRDPARRDALLSWAADSALAGPIGFAVRTTAGVEQVHNAVFVGPFRWALRSVGLFPSPNYFELETKIMFAQVVCRRLQADVDRVRAQRPEDPTLVIFGQFFGVLNESTRGLLTLLRHYGKTSVLPPSVFRRTLSEYMRQVSALHYHGRVLEPWLAACRMNEAAIAEYDFRLATDPDLLGEFGDSLGPKISERGLG